MATLSAGFRASQLSREPCTGRRSVESAIAVRRLGAAGLIFQNKISQINVITGYGTILTWPVAVSMVRAAFKGNGALFPSIAVLFRVSTAWPAAQETTKAEMGVATNRLPTKLRFPQGSEISISVSPKFGVTARLRLTNPDQKTETEQPGPRQWRAVSVCRPSWSRVLSSER
jgi:hypothetical protein